MTLALLRRNGFIHRVYCCRAAALIRGNTEKKWRTGLEVELLILFFQHFSPSDGDRRVESRSGALELS